jgi:hypothetical protein
LGLEKVGVMARTWQTEEVIRQLEEEHRVEIKELIEDAEVTGHCPEEAVRKWVRSVEAPKALNDAIYRFCNNPERAFNLVEWDEVVQHFSELEPE